MPDPTFFSGTECSFFSGRVRFVSSAFDATNGKVVVVYQDFSGGVNNLKGMAVVGTISDLGVTFGTPAVFRDTETTDIDIAFDEASGKFVVTHWNSTAYVGTVSGDSITFGAPVVFDATGSTMYTKVSAAGGSVVVAYVQQASYKGYAVAGTVSGTSISFGTPAMFETLRPERCAITYVPGVDKFAVAYSLYAAPYGGNVVLLDVSGTAVSSSAAFTFYSSRLFHPVICWDTSASKLILAFFTNSSEGLAITGEISESSVAFSASTQFSSTSYAYSDDIVYHAGDETAYLTYIDYDASTDVMLVGLNVSAGVLQATTPITISTGACDYSSVVRDSVANRVAVSYYNGTTQKGVSKVFWYGYNSFWTNFHGQTETV